MSQTLQSVAHALLALQVLQGKSDMGVTDIAGAVGVGTSTAHRLLTTLQQYGFVEQSEGRRYKLGPAMLLSPQEASIAHCIDISRLIMRSLRDLSRETVHIATLVGPNTKFIAAIESQYMMRVTARLDREIPAHTSAAGKVLLAQLEREQLQELYPNENLPQVTANTIATGSELLEALEEVKAAGYGRNYEESEVGLVAIAVPIARPTGHAICSLTLTGPTARFNPEGAAGISVRERELRNLLVEHCQRIERELRY
ncbi:IclR family transcriptional regulator [Pseudarthrobacter sp. CC12]|uniref:IclR family transcriptional regulator n=1 Tax=Pseudarthrobacter sp. CC12 TaxID=3029193 RepID=UPI003264E460